MKFSMIALVLVFGVTMCSAQNTHSTTWAPYTTDGYEDMLGYWMPQPVTPDDLNNASALIKEYIPSLYYDFHLAVEEAEKLDASDTTAVLEKFGEFLGQMDKTGQEAGEAYYKFYEVLYRVMGAGFSWEKYNQKLSTLLYESYHNGKPVPTPDEIHEALMSDLKGIREEIGWTYFVVMQGVQTLKEDALPPPVYVVKEIAAIQYMSDKIMRDVYSVVYSVHSMMAYMQYQPSKKALKTNTMEKIRDLLKDYAELKKSTDKGVKDALENVGKNARAFEKKGPASIKRKRRALRTMNKTYSHSRK